LSYGKNLCFNGTTKPSNATINEFIAGPNYVCPKITLIETGVDVLITFFAIFANFLRKNGVFSKNNVTIEFLLNLAVV
jgi:hypothetical protein